MQQNVIVPGSPNTVVMTFSYDITIYSEILMIVGSESYSSADDPANLYVEGRFDLVLDVGLVTSLTTGYYNTTIYGDGELLTGHCIPMLGDIKVC